MSFFKRHIPKDTIYTPSDDLDRILKKIKVVEHMQRKKRYIQGHQPEYAIKSDPPNVGSCVQSPEFRRPCPPPKPKVGYIECDYSTGKKPNCKIVFEHSVDKVPSEIMARMLLLMVENYCNHNSKFIEAELKDGKFKFDFTDVKIE